jgi:hypothetical protein
VELTLQEKTDKALLEARKQIDSAKREIDAADQIVKEKEKEREREAQSDKADAMGEGSAKEAS